MKTCTDGVCHQTIDHCGPKGVCEVITDANGDFRCVENGTENYYNNTEIPVTKNATLSPSPTVTREKGSITNSATGSSSGVFGFTTFSILVFLLVF